MKILSLAIALSLPLLAQDKPTIEQLQDQLAAKDAEIASLKSAADAKLSVLSQTVSNCFQAMDKLTLVQQPARQPQRPARPEPPKEQK